MDDKELNRELRKVEDQVRMWINANTKEMHGLYLCRPSLWMLLSVCERDIAFGSDDGHLLKFEQQLRDKLFAMLPKPLQQLAKRHAELLSKAATRATIAPQMVDAIIQMWLETNFRMALGDDRRITAAAALFKVGHENGQAPADIVRSVIGAFVKDVVDNPPTLRKTEATA